MRCRISRSGKGSWRDLPGGNQAGLSRIRSIWVSARPVMNLTSCQRFLSKQAVTAGQGVNGDGPRKTMVVTANRRDRQKAFGNCMIDNVCPHNVTPGKPYLDKAVAYSNRRALCFSSFFRSCRITSTISADESSNRGRPSGFRNRHANTYIASYQHSSSTSWPCFAQVRL